jgi:hypothetical protein
MQKYIVFLYKELNIFTFNEMTDTQLGNSLK